MIPSHPISRPTEARGPAWAESAVDAALMRAIAGGDERALSAFYDRHSPTVFAFCVRSLGDRALAEELVSDIFWEIWDRSDRYDATRASPRTYLMNVTRSRIIDRLRARRAGGRAAPTSLDGSADGFPSDTIPVPAGDPGPMDELADLEQRQRLRQAMQRLSPDQRQAIELAFFDALSHSEVAERLAQPIGTIKTRIRQGLIRLREALGGSAEVG